MPHKTNLENQSNERKAFDYAGAAARVYDPAAAASDLPPDPDTAQFPQATVTTVDAGPEPPAFQPPAAPEPPPLDVREEDPAGVADPAPPDQGPAAKPKAMRFASHDEAERGYANLFAERQRLAEELKSIQTATVASRQQEYDARVAEVRREQMADYVRQRAKQHNAAMAELDPNDQGYDDAVADLESRYQLDLDQFRANPPEISADKLPEPPQKPADPPDAAADPLADPARFVAGELGRHGLAMNDPFVGHLANQLPAIGTRLQDGRTVTLPLQVDMLVERMASETLSRYCTQSAAPDLPGLEISHPVLQHFVRQAPAVDPEGRAMPFYQRMQHAVRETRRWQADERRKLLAQNDAPLPSSFGPVQSGAGGGAGQATPTPMGSVLDRVRDQSRIR
jgi:hypothetical protein